MLSIAPERWTDRVAFEKSLPALSFQGEEYDFDALVAKRSNEGLEQQVSLAVARSRFAACQAAIARLASAFDRARIDKVILIGNDQMEVFTGENLPAFLVCWAGAIHNIPFTHEQKRRLGPGMAEAEHGHHGPEPEIYPGMPEFGRFLVQRLSEQEFDLSSSSGLPFVATSRSSGAPHAFGFVYRRIFGGKPVPNLPVFINTFYPPNQPSLKRCAAFGRAIGAALRAWESDERIAVIGSGGLSHFVIDEALDRAFLDAIRRRDIDSITAIPETLMQSGTSELKNWLVTAAILEQTGLALAHHDYIPCYRSVAGTGNAMGFAEWR
jgi:OH-DDVA oxygenase